VQAVEDDFHVKTGQQLKLLAGRFLAAIGRLLL
jgi:hypothetical protein